MADRKQIDDGGAAFSGGLYEPQHGGSNDREPMNPGMSLRDYFAGQALAGICAGLCSDHSRNYKPDAYSRVDFTAAGKDAYTLADVMIAARKGGA